MGYEKRLIKQLLYEHCLNGRICKERFISLVNYINNTAPVVRCKECAYGVKTRDEDIFLCAQYDNTHYDTFYCAEGARKDEVEE